MDPASPYQAPQADLTPQPDLTPEPELTSQPETFPKLLPAIVGVGATMTFWFYLTHCTLAVLCSGMIRLFPDQDIQGLYVILHAIDIFMLPLPFALGLFFLSQVQEETGAEPSLKLSWLLLLGHWLWLIVAANETKSEPIPPAALWAGNAIGQAYILALFWGCWRLSKFCADGQMRRWSRIALTLGAGCYLINVFRDGCELFIGPKFYLIVTEQQFRILAQVYEGLYYVNIAFLIPVIYCASKAMLRIENYAEVEAARNVVTLMPLASPAEDSEHE